MRDFCEIPAFQIDSAIDGGNTDFVRASSKYPQGFKC